ncbi:MAG: response regulator [Gammaproteobacteria bacterium]|nr:response regulator [Gammaproteobacteria bacterium]
MVKKQNSAQEKIQALQNAYLDQLPEKISELDKLWHDLATNSWQEESHQKFYRAVHSLAGSGETFGLRQLSQNARQLEKLFSEISPGSTPRNDVYKQVLALLNATKEAALMPAQSITSEQPDKLDKLDKLGTVNNDESVLIFLNDKLFAEGLAALLLSKNYQTRVFSDIQKLTELTQEKRPQAIIIDTLVDENKTTYEQIAALRIEHPTLPIIAAIDSDNIVTRLAAQRAGASLIFTHPIDTKALVESLNKIKASNIITPYKVLIVDDDELLSAFYAETLQLNNIITETLANPLATLDVLKRFLPDLILLDIHMDGINGIELAGLIRQFTEYDTIPVVFLSTETDIQSQLSAIDQVGDFIKKPVWPEYLITTVISKCRHARKLKEAQENLKQTLNEYEHQKLAMDQHSIVSISDPDGTITYVNNHFCDISEFSEEEMIGKNHRILKSNEHDEHFYADMWGKISSGNVWHGEIKNRKKNGGYYWVESTIVPFLDENGLPYQYVSIRTDITEIKDNELAQKTIHERLSEQNEALITLTNNSNLISLENKTAYQLITSVIARCLHVDRASIWFFNKDNNTLDCSVMYDAKKATYITTEPLSLIELTDYISSISKEHLACVDKVISSEPSSHFHNYYLKPNDIRAHMSAGIFSSGECIGMICFEHTSSERKWWPEDKNFAKTIADYVELLIEQWERISVQQALQESEFRLKQSLAFSNMATMDLNIQTKEMYWSELACPMFGYDKNTEATYDNFVSAIHPMDRDNVIAELTECIENGDEFKQDFRVIWPDETIRWLSGSGNITYDEDNKPLHMLGMLCDITVQKLVQDELIYAKENAEKANRAKSEFLSRMSHELRTPMNAILGFAQLLQVSEDRLTDNQDDSVNEILKAGRHLLELINEVLDLSRIEAGKFELSCKSINLQEMISECLKLVEPLYSTQKINIINNLKKNQPCFVYADQTRLKQVIVNLLSNAIKYNTTGGSITISAEPNSYNQIRLSVTDTGKGIKDEYQPYIFEAFERAGSDNTNIEGTGIGLVITKHLVELMGGHVGFESKYNKGSTFWFELPIDKEVADIHLHQTTHKYINLPDKKSDKEIFNILYIEDNLANQKLVYSLLAKKDYIKLTMTTTAEDGLHIARSMKPNLILLDINLPGMNGYEAINHIRHDKTISDTPVVAITAQAMSTKEREENAHNFDHFITKPIDLQLLLGVIDDHIKKDKRKNSGRA